MLKRIHSVALSAGLALLTIGSAQAQLEYEAEVRRTSYGIPHIKADNFASLGYGYGYA